MELSIKEQKRYIQVEEMRELVNNVYKFYEERGNPKMNAIWLADLILKRLKNDKDMFINTEGETGSGKSNLTLLLALLMCRYAGKWRNTRTGEIKKVLPRTAPLPPEWEQLSIDFDYDTNMSFLDESTNLRTKFFNISRYAPFIVDEGSKNLHKYGWQNKLQQMLIQMSATERYQNKAFFVCFPNFKELTTVFRNDRIKIRLYTYARHTKQKYASCIISIKDVSRWTSDPWHIEENAKTFEYLLRRVPASQRSWKHVLYAERKLKGYAGNFEFPSLREIAPKIWNTYYHYKMKNAQKEAGEEEEIAEKDKHLIIWKYAFQKLIRHIQMLDPKITISNLSTLTGLPLARISKTINEHYDIQDESDSRAEAAESLEHETLNNTQT